MTTFRGERLYLRELTEADVTDNYLAWFNDDDVTSFLEARNLTRESVIEYMNHGRETGTYYMYAVCDNETDKHVGNVKIGPIDLKHNTSDLVTVMGDPNFRGKGLGTEIIKLASAVAFEKYDIRKLSGGMYEDNIASIKAYTKAGWVIEGRLKAHYQLNGKIMDRVLVSCFNPKYPLSTP
jgi:RimJ/RimL family protein N-acetyltransferase